MSSTTLHPAGQYNVAHPQRILVATDLSDLGWLVPHAIAQARAAHADVTLVHAVSALYAASMGGAEVPIEGPAELMDDARRALAGAMALVERERIPCSVDVRIGRASEVIDEVVRHSRGSVRVLMGTHGRGKLGQMAFGSVAHELLADARVPVFLVGPHAREAARAAAPKHILHPVSFTGDSLAGAAQAFALAEAHHAQITLLHVLEESDDDQVNPARMVQWAHDALAGLAAESGMHAESVHLQVVKGDVAAQIVRIARQSYAQWIVLATTAETSASLLHESRAFRVMAEAECPVLLFPGSPARVG